MTNGNDVRGIALEILMEIIQQKEYSHIVIRNALDKVQYLPKQERAFINRLVEGTVEYQLRIDYILDQYSSVKVQKMKPVIRNILRSGVYQLLFMDGVPDSAACNEAVKLAQKKGFYNLKGFVNGVLRTISRERMLSCIPIEIPIFPAIFPYFTPCLNGWWSGGWENTVPRSPKACYRISLKIDPPRSAVSSIG